jgi:uncharacterized protein (UPF0332 family)
MSFDWSEYLIVAKELASQTTTSLKTQSNIKVMLLNTISRAYYGTFKKVAKPSLDEAKLRCAISRAYYGAFRKARNHLRDKDSHTPSALERGNTHQIVINLFGNSNDMDRQMIGQFLRDLRSARNKADYDDAVPNLPGLTMTVLLQSEQVIDLLKTL